MNDQFYAFLNDYHAGVTTRCADFLGCHRQRRGGTDGFVFRVWAPNARSVSVVGEFNFWSGDDLPMVRFPNGVWEGWSGYAKEGDAYKYLLRQDDGSLLYKTDPVGFRACRSPDTSSVICDLSGFVWHDSGYFARQSRNWALDAPVNIYEVHLASWRRREDGSLYSYSELAPRIAGYAKNMGYTHVELMPLAEYPYDPSWGYQVTGFYAPTSRFGSPKEFMELVDTLHRAGVGVILDWVCASFPKDACGLFEFDGTRLYEPPDPRGCEDPVRGTRLFDYRKPEIRNFLISNAVFWLETYHLDGIRVGSVGSIAGSEDCRDPDGIAFLRELNRACFALRPGVIMASDGTMGALPVTRPDYEDGLGFLLAWNTGWTGETLSYFSDDPIDRKYDHGKLTDPLNGAFSENYVLPLGHDEVVHGRGSLIGRMPGEYDQRFAGLRLLLGYQMACPGKKLLFMGGEFGQFIEWNAGQSLDWLLLGYERHRQMQAFVRDLNHFYRRTPALWQGDRDRTGFRWIQSDDRDNSVLAFCRSDRQGGALVCVLNFTPVAREGYRLGVPGPGIYRCVFSSDDQKYGGLSTELHQIPAENEPFGVYNESASFRIAPMSVAFYAREPERR